MSITPPVFVRVPGSVLEGAIVTVPPLPAISDPKDKDLLLTMDKVKASAGDAAAATKKTAINNPNGVAIRCLRKYLVNQATLRLPLSAVLLTQ